MIDDEDRLMIALTLAIVIGGLIGYLWLYFNPVPVTLP